MLPVRALKFEWLKIKTRKSETAAPLFTMYVFIIHIYGVFLQDYKSFT
jgi:hypothetical protein